MNRMFSSKQGWDGYPAQSYARIEQTEPIVPDGTTAVLFSLSAVHAHWSGFAAGGAFDLHNPVDTKERNARYWQDRFNGKPPKTPDPLDEMPVYSIDIALKPSDRWYHELSVLLEEDWVRVTLDASHLHGVAVGTTCADNRAQQRGSKLRQSIQSVFRP